LAKNSTIFFVLKGAKTRKYFVVGTAKSVLVRQVNSSDKDEDWYSEKQRWPLVIDLAQLQEFASRVPANEAFSDGVLKKIAT